MSSLQLSTPIIPYVCEGVYYGRGLCVNSCDGALRSMAILSGRPTQQFTWGERAIGHYDSLLSQRHGKAVNVPRATAMISPYCWPNASPSGGKLLHRNGIRRWTSFRSPPLERTLKVIRGR